MNNIYKTTSNSWTIRVGSLAYENGKCLFALKKTINEDITDDSDAEVTAEGTFIIDPEDGTKVKTVVSIAKEDLDIPPGEYHYGFRIISSDGAMSKIIEDGLVKILKVTPRRYQ
jgi:hypothetical protein